jgi:tetratricopeptide (TPR) repeat protein
MSSRRSLLIMAAIIMLLSGIVYSQSDDMVDRAVKKYLRGDYTGAIDDFERSLEIENNEKARQLLYKSIVEEGKRRFNNGEYKSSLVYLERAAGINPDDYEVAGLLKDLKVKLNISDKAKKESGVAVDMLQEKIVSERRAKDSYRKKVNSISAERNKIADNLRKNESELETAKLLVEELKDTSRKKQKLTLVIMGSTGLLIVFLGILLFVAIMKLYNASGESQYQIASLEDSFKKRMKEAEEESEELEERVARSINNMADGQKDVVKQLSLSAAGRTQEDIEEIKDKLEQYFELQQDRLLELLKLQVKALSSEKTEKIDLGDRVITDVNPHIRARADSVELIPRTVTDPKVAEKMLRPYLNDPNNRVRGNACVAIYQYNPEMSVKALQDMVSSPDKWMRLSAAWAAGEIASPDMTHILRKLLDDVDDRVRNRAISAFENMAEIKEDVADEIRKMIDEGKNQKE